MMIPKIEGGGGNPHYQKVNILPEKKTCEYHRRECQRSFQRKAGSFYLASLASANHK